MKKYAYLFIGVIVLSGCGITGNKTPTQNLSQPVAKHVRVSVTGESEEAAKQRAFVRATELATGTILVSERTVDDQKLIKNQIDTYSSSHVYNHKLVEKNGDKYVYDVWVLPNQLASARVTLPPTMVSYNANEINQRAAISKKAVEDKQQLINSVLDLYPTRAIIVKFPQEPVTTETTKKGTIAGISYEIQWSKGFVTSFRDILNMYDTREKHCSYKVEFFNERKPGYITSSATNCINDNFLESQLYKKEKEAIILKLSVSKKEKVIYSGCYDVFYESFLFRNNFRLNINLDQKITGRLEIPAAYLDADKISGKIIADRKECV